MVLLLINPPPVEAKAPSPYISKVNRFIVCRYLELTNCDLQMVGTEFSRKPYAMAVPEGSPLKDQLNEA